jgi:hypothetical protein
MKDKAKIVKQLPTGWQDEADAMSSEQLKKVIVESAANIAETQRAEENDEDLAKKKYAATDAAAPYKDAKKCQGAKISYALLRLAERGDPAGTGSIPEAVEKVREAAELLGGKVSVSVGGKKVGEF